MRKVLMALALIAGTATPAAAEFLISFTWGDTPACNTGKAKRTGNPQFVVKGLPAGTDTVQFRLKDLNVPSYNHGGGKVRMGQNGTVPAGVFKYKGPCPPGEVHTYEWTATAKKGNKTLGTARAARKFPE